MLVAVCDGNNLQNIKDCDADVIELRIDYLADKNFENIKNIINIAKKPLIFTYRGGDVTEFAHFQPDYIDFDCSISNEFIKIFHAKYPKIKIIRSYHNFDNTPDDLINILNQILHPDIYAYKIITTAQNSVDNFKVLDFLMANKTQYKIITHCMGNLGIPSRVIGAVLGNYFTYSNNCEHEIAPGIISTEDFLNIYNFKSLNSKTKIYALLGDPVAHSIGDIFHNKNFKNNNINAVYVKIKLEGLANFFINYAKKYFSGCSITMPFKEQIMPFIDHFVDDSINIGSINTIKIKHNKVFAINTDKTAIANLLEKYIDLANKNILILGLGGSSKAIAFELNKKKAIIDILNRSLKSVKNCQVFDFTNFKSNKKYDVIINTIPNKYITSKILGLFKNNVTAKPVYIELDYSTEASLIKNYMDNIGATIIHPNEIFAAQAKQQFEFWI